MRRGPCPCILLLLLPVLLPVCSSLLNGQLHSSGATHPHELCTMVRPLHNQVVRLSHSCAYSETTRAVSQRYHDLLMDQEFLIYRGASPSRRHHSGSSNLSNVGSKQHANCTVRPENLQLQRTVGLHLSLRSSASLQARHLSLDALNIVAGGHQKVLALGQPVELPQLLREHVLLCQDAVPQLLKALLPQALPQAQTPRPCVSAGARGGGTTGSWLCTPLLACKG